MKKTTLLMSMIFCLLNINNVYAKEVVPVLKWTDPDYKFIFTHKALYKNSYELLKPCPSKNYQQCAKDDFDKNLKKQLENAKIQCKEDVACFEKSKSIFTNLGLLDVGFVYGYELTADKIKDPKEKDRFLLDSKSKFKNSNDVNYEKSPKEESFSFVYQIKNIKEPIYKYENDFAYDVDCIEVNLPRSNFCIEPNIYFYILDSKLIKEVNFTDIIEEKRITRDLNSTDVQYLKNVLKNEITEIKPFYKNKSKIFFYKLPKAFKDFEDESVYCAINKTISVCFEMEIGHPNAKTTFDPMSEKSVPNFNVNESENYIMKDILNSFAFKK